MAGSAAVWWLLVALVFVLAIIGLPAAQQAGSDWTQFGWDLAGSGASSSHGA